jgi:hypothetical protein
MKTNRSDTSEKRAVVGFEALTIIEGDSRFRMKVAAKPALSEGQSPTAAAPSHSAKIRPGVTPAQKRRKAEAAIVVVLFTVAVYLLVGCFRTLSSHVEVVRGRGVEPAPTAVSRR